MVGPQMPGQNPAQQQMQQQRQMQYAWLQEQRKKQPLDATPVDRPGFFTRLILGLISLVLLVVVLVSLVGAGWAIKDGVPAYTAVGVGVALVAGLIRRAVRRKAQGF
jgi:hypothetical protein